MLKCPPYMFLLVVNVCFVLQATGKSDLVTSSRQEELIAERKCSNLKRHEIESHLSTKTPYRVVANLNDKAITYPGCQPTRIWSVIRHGTRNPSKEDIEKAKLSLVRLKKQILLNPQTNLCSEELTRLRLWHFNVSSDEEKYLTSEGVDELIELAERMQNRFPNLLPDQYDPNLYYFKYTKTQRTLLSAQSFATGLFGRHRIGSVIYPEALHRDPILRNSKFVHDSVCEPERPGFISGQGLSHQHHSLIFRGMFYAATTTTTTILNSSSFIKSLK